MTDAAIGYGATYRIAGVDLAEVTAVKPPGATADRIEATHMKSLMFVELRVFDI